MRWGKRLMTALALLSVGSVAAAQPAGNSSFVPVSMSQTGPEDISTLVEAGDHLWKISEEHLATVLGRPVDDTEVDPYWRSVIGFNRDRLTSGDPDLIYPGETVILPPTG